MMPRIYRRDSVASLTPEAQHEMACAFAEEIFGRKGQTPFLYILNDGESQIWIETPWENDREKEAHVAAVTVVLQSSKCIAYSFISEAWVAVRTFDPEKPGKDDLFKGVGSLADLPKKERDDVVMIMTETRDGETFSTRYLVTMRPPGLGLNYLGPRVDMGDELKGMTGRLTGLFTKKVIMP
jgi:hypothetical protein